MNKWFERVVIAVVAAFMIAALIGIYLQWRDCTDAGGMMVRGMLGNECMK